MTSPTAYLGGRFPVRMGWRRRASLVALTLAVTGALGMLAAGVLTSQAGAQATPEGRISGTVEMGTADVELTSEATVELIVLAGTEVRRTQRAQVVDGTYEFSVPLDPEVRYIPRVQYGGVPYFAPPITLTPDSPEAEAEPVTVYETVERAPALAGLETVLTAVAIDRGRGQIGLIREDLIVNPTDRVFVGGTDRVTIRIPAPEGTTEAAGENADGQFALAEGVLTTTVPIRALEETALITRFLVEWAMQEDRYVLRVTVPIPTERIVVRIPQEYVHELVPDGGAERGPDEVLEAASGEAVPLYTVILEDAGPGDSLVVTLDGLALQVNRNPIAETSGAVLAGASALAILAVATGASLVVGRRRTEPAP